MIVRDIMQSQLLTASPQTSLKEVGRIIFGTRINALPVIDEKGNLVGIITDKDVTAKFYPSFEEYIDDYVNAKDFTAMEEKAKEVMKLKAIDVMKKDILTISPDTPILKASGLMIVKRVNQLPVVEEGRLIGIISHGDIFRSIMGKQVNFFSKENDMYNKIASNYDLLMDWNQRLTREMPFIIKLLQKNKTQKILDVGCGTGEHSIFLARKGFNVIGIDISEKMIDISQGKKMASDEKVRKNLEFKKASIGEIFSTFKSGFDAIICLGNTLPHIKGLDHSLEDFSKSLIRKGLLIIQIRNYDKIDNEKKRVLDIDFRKGEKEENEIGFIRFIDIRNDGKINFNILSMTRGKKGWKTSNLETTTHLLLKKDLLLSSLNRVGFTDIETFGSFEGERFILPKSPNLITVAYKK